MSYVCVCVCVCVCVYVGSGGRATTERDAGCASGGILLDLSYTWAKLLKLKIQRFYVFVLLVDLTISHREVCCNRVKDSQGLREQQTP